MSKWTFFTNHGHVMFLVSENPDYTVREMSEKVGITERAVQKILHDLSEDGFVKIGKKGRNNCYKIIGRKKLRHPIEKGCKIEELVELIQDKNLKS